MKILITGAAGFIGSHLALRLLNEGHEVIGVDNLNDYYDPTLKEARLNRLEPFPDFHFYKTDLENKPEIDRIFETHRPTHVVNLAAQAGVRYSLENPYAYINSNITGFLNILEACRHFPVEHLLYASSSSVYGGNQQLPFSTAHNVDHPVSLYAATKKSNELMAHTYSHLFNIPSTGLRFFTVYGPYGRPDMALFLFTQAILEGRPIQVFNHGQMERDFTYVDDIIEGIVRLLAKAPIGNPDWDETRDPAGTSFAPYRIYNIGNNSPVPLMRYIKALEDALGIEAEKEFLELQAGDVPRTFADVKDLEQTTGFKPATEVEDGIQRFVDWYKDYYGFTAKKDE